MREISDRVLVMIGAFEICSEAEEVAKVLAITDAVDHGVSQWIMWTNVEIVNSFMGYAAEGSERLALMIASGDDMVKTMLEAGVYPQEEFSLTKAAFTMRESFLDTIEAMGCYFDIHNKAKELYYHR
jgi:hypothetical protein